MQKTNLFSTPLWIFEPGKIIGSQLNEIKNTITSLESKKKGDDAKSLVGGWRLDMPHTLKELEVIRKYITFLTKCVIIDDLDLDVKHLKLEIISWLNVHPSGGMNRAHHHGTSVLSGIFYVHTPDGSGKLCIRDPRPGAYFGTKSFGLPIGAEVDSSGTRGSHVSYQPSAGQTYIFPGYLEHFVEPAIFEKETERRISIAFNIDFH